MRQRACFIIGKITTKTVPQSLGGVLRCRHWLKQDARWNISLPKELYTQLIIAQNYLTSDSHARSFSYPLLMTPQPFERTRMIEESDETQITTAMKNCKLITKRHYYFNQNN
jgi:hypothetical protein